MAGMIVASVLLLEQHRDTNGLCVVRQCTFLSVCINSLIGRQGVPLWYFYLGQILKTATDNHKSF